MKKGVKLSTLAFAVFAGACCLNPTEAKAEQNVLMQNASKSAKITGQVFDELGEPMIGVTVALKGSNAATVTDLKGNFSLSLSKGQGVLELRYIGYKSQEIKVSAGKHVSVKMELDAAGLDEVVVIGFGSVKKRDLTGSVASIKADVITAAPVSDVTSALQGRVSGLDVNAGEMRIRGNRSINGSNEPLVIIDGVQGGSMDDINPSDIESVEVLKDASSTAIYGSQGANGVIIITTKKAEKGKLAVSYDGYVRAEFRGDRADYRSPQDFYNTRKLAAQNAGLWASEADDLTLFDGDKVSYAAFKANSWTDYEDLLQRDMTVSTKHTLTLSGGNDKTTGRFSIGYANDGNKWKESNGTHKYTLRANIDHKIYDWISAGVNFQLAHFKNNASPYEKATTTALELGSPYGYYDVDADAYLIGDELVERPLSSTGYVNPLLDNHHGKRYSAESQRTNVVANAYLDLKPIDGLTIRSQFNTHLSNSSSGSYLDELAATNIEAANGTKNYATMTKATGTYVEWNNILTYNFTMLPEDHHLGVTLLTSWNKSIHDDLTASSYGQIVPGNLWWNLGNDNGDGIHDSNYTQSQNFSYAGRISYDWKSRYLFTASIRRDGSSKLAEGHKWEWFPSAAFAWRISDEAFMKSTKSWLDDLKLRATYGVTGNSGIGVYGTKSGITFANWSFAFQDNDANRYIPGVLDQRGSGLYVLGNTNTKWEMSKTIDFGFDAVLLNNRLNVTFDWYKTNTTDLILLRSLPTSAGMDGKYATYTNIGETQNTGFEFTINSRNIVTKDFTWNTTLTFSANNEEITKLIEDGENLQVGTNKEDGTYMLGHPIKSFNTFKYEGIWKTDEADLAAQYFKDKAKTQPFKPGDIKVADMNGDFVIDQNDDIGFVGSTSPDWFAGLNNDFRYKEWDFSIYMYARWGHWGESRIANFDPSTGGATVNYDYWVAGKNEGGSLPGLYRDRKLFDYTGYQSLWYCDQSFFKIKRMTVGYTLPKKVVDSIGINSFRVYATVSDPFYFVKEDWQKDYDPEGSQRSVTLGLNVNF